MKMSDSTLPENGENTSQVEEITEEQAPKEVDWKAAARKWEDRAKANRAAAKENEKLQAELAELQEKYAKAEKRLTSFQAKEQRAEWVKEIITEADLPADFAEVLRGDTREELAEHAAALKPLVNVKGIPVPGAGKTPETKSSPTVQTVRDLFGRN